MPAAGEIQRKGGRHQSGHADDQEHIVPEYRAAAEREHQAGQGPPHHGDEVPHEAQRAGGEGRAAQHPGQAVLAPEKSHEDVALAQDGVGQPG
ncbi:hypothetical protein D3C71_2058180 [compost metagenome]